MSLTGSILAFFKDAKFETVGILIALDIILGIAAAFKLGTFRLSYLSDFLRNDVLGKVVPWAALYIGAKLGNTAVIGVDLGKIADAAWVAVLAALVGSLASSLYDLKVGGVVAGARRADAAPARGVNWITGGENAGPPKD